MSLDNREMPMDGKTMRKGRNEGFLRKFFTSFRLFICTIAAGFSLLLTLPLQATIRILAQPMECLLPSLNVHFSIFFFNKIVLQFKGGPPVNVCVYLRAYDL